MTYTIRTNTARKAGLAIAAMLASFAVPLAAQSAAPAPVMEAGSAMMNAAAGPVSMMAAPGIDRGEAVFASAAPQAQSFILPHDSFMLSRGGRQQFTGPAQRSYRVPAETVEIGQRPITFDEPYMPGLSGDLEEFRPRQSVTFAL